MDTRKRPMGPPIEDITEEEDQQIKIYFRLMKTIPLEVKKSDTIKKVRTEFSEMEGISLVNLKSLCFAGNWLQNERKLVDYDIGNCSIVNVFLDSGFRILVHVKMSQIGKKITLDVDMRDTILAVKGKIQNKEGFAVSEQDLIYLGEQLEDGKTLASYKIEEGSIIYALFRAKDVMQIYVGLDQNRRIISLKVKTWYTIENVKSMIESTVGVLAEKYIVFVGQARVENHMTLADLHISEGETLIFKYDMCIYVKSMTGRTTILEVDASFTIENVKEMIEEHEGTHVIKQRLIFAGMQLEDSCTLGDYHIPNEAVIHLVLRLCGC